MRTVFGTTLGKYALGLSKMDQTAGMPMEQTGFAVSGNEAMAISSTTRVCPHCSEPMFLINLEREGHDHLRSYKCSNCKKTSQFVRQSDAPALWLQPNERPQGPRGL